LYGSLKRSCLKNDREVAAILSMSPSQQHIFFQFSFLQKLRNKLCKYKCWVFLNE
jgi:hypothetical protein